LQLYELTDNYLALEDLETEAEYAVSLDEIEEEINTKIENIGKVIRSVSAEKDAYKAEIIRMQNKVKSLDSKMDWLKEYLKVNMDHLGIDKAGEIVKVSLRTSPPSCNLIDINQVPDEFKMAKVTLPVLELPETLKQYINDQIISKKEIIGLWKDGVDIDGTEVVQTKHVRIA